MHSPIRLIFLVFYYEAWDALAEMHRQVLADPRFDVAVVAIDRRLTGDSGFGGADAVSAFFTAAGVRHEVNSDLANFWGTGEGPDYVVVNYPWQRNYPPAYRPDSLARIARIIYVPYYTLPMAQEPVDGRTPELGFTDVAAHAYTQRMHQLASLVFLQDEETRDAFAREYSDFAHQRAHFVGSPKLDALIANSSRDFGRAHDDFEKVLVWAPHHSYSPHWLNFGNFATSHEAMLKFARANRMMKIILRPHPFMFGTLTDRGVMNAGQLKSWLDAWNDLPNTSIDSKSNTANLFASADYLLTDGISFLAEWPLLTGKPAIFLENPERWKFTALGEICGRLAVTIPHIDGVSAAITECDEITSGATEKSEAFASQLRELRAAAIPFAGQTANKIVELVVEHAATNPPLIDPSEVTSTPWEMQPGREPQE